MCENAPLQNQFGERICLGRTVIKDARRNWDLRGRCSYGRAKIHAVKSENFRSMTFRECPGEGSQDFAARRIA